MSTAEGCFPVRHRLCRGWGKGGTSELRVGRWAFGLRSRGCSGKVGLDIRCVFGVVLIALGLFLSCGNRSAERSAVEEEPTRSPSPLDGKGSAVMSPGDPVPARSRGTWTFTFTVGDGGIPSGGGVAFQVSPFWGWSRPHNIDEDVAGYCTVFSSSRDAALDITSNTDRYYLLMFVKSGRLESGETVTIIYGDTQDGAHPGAAARTDSYAERYQEFLFKTDGDGDGVYAEIPVQPRLPVSAREAVQLWVNAPSLVAPGEVFEVSVAALDGMGNRAETYRGDVRLEPIPSDAGFETVCHLTAADRGAKRVPITLAEAGLYVVEARGADGLSASSNPVLCGTGNRFTKVYWGDIHGHSMLSDGTGHPHDYYEYARDVAGLDVASLTDHDAFGLRPLAGASWALCTSSADSFYEPGRFVTFLGYEWTSWTYGHRNVYFPGTRGEVYSHTTPESSTPEGLWRAVRPWGAVTVAHHVGGGPIATDWDHEPPEDVEMLVELFSVHGSSESYGCERMIYSPVEGHFVQDALARGYRLGMFASGDGHIGHTGRSSVDYAQGLVAFQAPDLTRESVWDALTSRRVYGTTGARILLEFDVNRHPMGSAIPDDEIDLPRRVTARVLGTAPIERMELIKNNVVIRVFPCDGILGEFEHTDATEPHRGDYYYVRVEQTDGHLAWSSPIWLGSDK
jgi:hypothetical protein